MPKATPTNALGRKKSPPAPCPPLDFARVQQQVIKLSSQAMQHPTDLIVIVRRIVIVALFVFLDVNLFITVLERIDIAHIRVITTHRFLLRYSHLYRTRAGGKQHLPHWMFHYFVANLYTPHAPSPSIRAPPTAHPMTGTTAAEAAVPAIDATPPAIPAPPAAMLPPPAAASAAVVVAAVPVLAASAAAAAASAAAATVETPIAAPIPAPAAAPTPVAAASPTFRYP